MGGGRALAGALARRGGEEREFLALEESDTTILPRYAAIVSAASYNSETGGIREVNGKRGERRGEEEHGRDCEREKYIEIITDCTHSLRSSLFLLA